MEQIQPISPGLFERIYRFYSDGFRKMTLGRTLWKIIIIKLIVFFAVLKLFFFQDFLATRFHDDKDRAEYVISQLTQPVIKANNTLLKNREEVHHD